LPNFKANLWDTAYGELEGSGISFGNGDQAIGDPTFSQLRPFRVMGTAAASGNTLTLSGPLTGYNGLNLSVVGQQFEVWRAGESETAGMVQVSAVNGLLVTLTPVGFTLTNGTQYTVLQEIPYYHANNAASELSANPINPITQSGYYAVQVRAVDKVGNTSFTSGVYTFGAGEPIEYNPPTGSFSLSVDKEVALAGEVITVESEVINTISGTSVADGTMVTVWATHGTVVSTDQDPYVVGIQVMTSGGTVTFQVQSTTPGTGTVHAEVASAYSDPSPEITYIPNYPYGEYTLLATPSSVVADGSSEVIITGPTVTDQYGNIITDSNAPHNLFTVTAPGFVIMTPDADGIAGHQVKPQSNGSLVVVLKAGTVSQSTQFTLQSVTQWGTPAVPTASGSVGLTLHPGDPGSPIILSTNNETLIAKSTETSLISSQPVTDEYGNIVADGTLITVSIAGRGSIISVDADGNPGNGIQRATVAGIITFQVSAQGASVGDGVITAQSVTGSASGNLTLHFVADIPTGIITLTPVPSQIVADGSSISAVTGDIIRDQYGNSVGAGVIVRVSATDGQLRHSSQSVWTSGQIDVPTSADGSVYFELQSSLIVGHAHVSAQTVVDVGGTDLIGSAEGSCDVGFIAGLPSGEILLSSNFDEVIAGSPEIIIVTGEVKDAYGHPVADDTEITVKITGGFIVSADTNLSVPYTQVKTSGGSFEFRFTAQGAPVGVCVITAESQDMGAQGEITVDYISGPPSKPFVLTADPAFITADGQTRATVISGIIRDAYNNIVKENEVIVVQTGLGLITDGSGVPASEIELEVDNTGRISFEVISSTQSGTANLTAQSVNGTATGSGSVIFAPGIPANEITLTAVPTELTANSGQISQIISGVIRDVNGNIVSDGTRITVVTDGGELSGGGTPSASIEVESTGGIISFELLSLLSSGGRVLAGTATIFAYGEGDIADRAEGSVELTFVYGDPYQPIVMTAHTTPLTADGQSSTQITSSPILDRYDNPMRAGVLVTLSSTLGQILEDESEGIVGNQVTTDSDGRITFTLKSGTQSGSSIVTALSYIGTAQGQLAVGFEAGLPAGTIYLYSTSDEVVLDGSSYTTITSSPVTDAYGNTVSDGTLINVFTDNGYISDSVLSTVNGIVSFTLSSQGGTLGTASVIAESSEGNADGSIDITFIPGPPSGILTLTASPESIVADPNGQSPVQGVTTDTTITSGTITDALGNVIADGELFTVYTNRGVIITADEDPLLGGVQVAVTGGIISFELSSYGSAKGTATVYAQSVHGMASGSTQVLFTDTGTAGSIQIVLDADRPESDRYVAWNSSRQVTVICKDIMGNSATNAEVTLEIKQNESGSLLMEYAGYAGSGDGTSFTGQTDATGKLLVTYKTPVEPVPAEDAEDILDASSANVPATEVDDRRFIVTTDVPPLFRFYSMGSQAYAGDFHPFIIEIINQYDEHMTLSEIQTQFPSLNAVFYNQPSAHAGTGKFYVYDNTGHEYDPIEAPVALPWDGDGYATVYYRDTLAGTVKLFVADENQTTGVKTASKDLTIVPGMILTGAPQFSISASPQEILANGISVSTITSDVVADEYGNIIEGFMVNVSTDHGTLVAVDVDGNSANGLQVATGADGRFSFSLRSEASVQVATVNVTTFAGGPSDTVSINFVAGAPSGVIALYPDPPEIAADPSNSVTVTSSIIRDQWGNQVLAGQLITVSSTLGTITTPDADSDPLNGLQVAVSATGRISFAVQAGTQAGRSTVTVSSVAGAATGSAVIDFIPGAPSGVIVLHATPAQVIANGPNSSVITSDPITDGTNVVRNGELFTVFSDYGTVVALDEGPQEGIQVKSNNGVISFVFNPNTGKRTVVIQAVSVNGNASGFVSVVLRSEQRSTGTIQFVAPAPIVADGVTKSTVTSYPLYDRYGNLLDAGIQFNVSTNRGTINETGLQTAVGTTNAEGIIEFQIKSSTTAGLATVTVQCVNNPASTGTAGVQFLPGDPAHNIVLQAEPSVLIANSNYTSVVSVPVLTPIKDIFGNVVQDGTVVALQTDLGHFVVDGQEVTQTEVTTSGGLFSVVFKATDGPGTAHIDAMSGTASGSVYVDLIIGAPYQPIALSADPGTLTADGTSQTTITSTTILDQFNNQVPAGSLITITRSAGTILTPDADTNVTGHQIAVSAQGIISFVMRSPTTATTATVQAKAVSGPAEGFVNISFTAGAPAGNIVLTATPPNTPLIARSGSTLAITSSVITDAHGNPVGANIPVTVSTTRGLINSTSSSLQVFTDQNSRIQVTLKADAGSSVGTAQVTASTDTGTAYTVSALNISFIADVPAGQITLTASPDTITADGSATSTVTSEPITDKYGNIVAAGTLVTVWTSWGSIIFPADAEPVNYPNHQVVTGAQGSISFTVQSAQVAGLATITAGSIEGSAYGTAQVTGIAGQTVDLIVILPGESFDRTRANRKTGTPQNQAINVPFDVKVYPVDQFGNIVYNETMWIELAPLSSFTTCAPSFLRQFDGSAGQLVFSVEDTIAGQNLRINVADNIASPVLSGISSQFNILAGSPIKLQVILPGQTAVPGDSGTGIIGTPNIQEAGVPFNVIVNYVDQFYNVVTNSTGTIQLRSSGIGADVPGNLSLQNGTCTFVMTERTLTTPESLRRLTANEINNITLNAQSSYFHVQDTLAPHVVSFSIQNGAQYTTSQQVSLQINAVDLGGSAIQMRFRNEDQTWAQAGAYEPYQPEKTGYSLSSGLGHKTVYVRVRDANGYESGEYSAGIIYGTPPVASAGGNYTGVEGDTIVFSATAFDPDANESLTFVWDLDNNGIFDNEGQTVSFQYLDNISVPVSVKVTDQFGLTHIDTVQLTVTNAIPVVVGINDVLCEVGQSVSIDSITFTDAGSLDTHTAQIEWGDTNSDTLDPATAGQPFSFSHTYTQSGSYAVTVSVQDKDGDTGTSSFTIRARYKPVAHAGTGYTGTEGVEITLDATASYDNDPDAALIFEWDLTGNDQYTDAYGDSVQYTWNDQVSATIAVKVTDTNDGYYSVATAGVTIYNASPEITTEFDDVSIEEGETVSLDGIEFSDLGILDTHRAVINWGYTDAHGEPVVDTIEDVTSPFNAVHTFTDNGVYTVTVTVEDRDGGSDSASFIVTVGLETIIFDITVENDRSVTLSFDPISAKEYEVFFSDTETVLYSGSLSDWVSAGLVYNGIFNDSGNTDSGDDIPDRVHPQTVGVRYYRIVRTDDLDEHGTRCCSSDIGYIRNIKLEEGRNFVGKCDNEDMLGVAFDPRFLPGGITDLERASIYYYTATETIQGFVFNGQGSNALWYAQGSHGTQTEADSYPMADGQGAMIILPYQAGSYILPKTGFIKQVPQTEMTLNAGEYTIISWPYGCETTLDDSGLAQSGILGGTTARRADQLLFLDPETQQYDQPVFFCTSQGAGQWRYLDQTACSRKLKPGEGVLFKRNVSSSFTQWTAQKPYINHGKTIAP
jgi:hypothetical protein